MTRVTIHLPEVPVLPRRVRWYFWDTSRSSLLTAKFTQSQSRQIPGTARVGHKRCSHFPSGFTSAGSLGYLQNHVKKRDALGMLAVFLWEDVPQMPFFVDRFSRDCSEYGPSKPTGWIWFCISRLRLPILDGWIIFFVSAGSLF